METAIFLSFGPSPIGRQGQKWQDRRENDAAVGRLYRLSQLHGGTRVLVVDSERRANCPIISTGSRDRI